MLDTEMTRERYMHALENFNIIDDTPYWDEKQINWIWYLEREGI